jgi:DNA-binding MarR family transcriptional regulator
MTMPAGSLLQHRQDLLEQVFAMRHVMKRLFGGGVYKELLEELQSVTIHQLQTLGHLKGGSLTMGELAKVLEVTESSATAVTDRLVRQGLVERQSDPNDRRVVRLSLSHKGSALVSRLDEAAAAKTAETLAVLSDAQLASLVEILSTLESRP